MIAFTFANGVMNLYVNGITDFLSQLDQIAQKIIPCMERSVGANDTAELEQLIVAQELAWNHNSLIRVCK